MPQTLILMSMSYSPASLGLCASRVSSNESRGGGPGDAREFDDLEVGVVVGRVDGVALEGLVRHDCVVGGVMW